MLTGKPPDGTDTAKLGDDEEIGKTVSGAPPLLHTFMVATRGAVPHAFGNTNGLVVWIFGGVAKAVSRKKIGSSCAVVRPVASPVYTP